MIVDELIAVLGYDLRGEDERRRFQRGLDAINNRVRAFSVAATRAAVIAGGALAAGMGIAGRSVIRTAAEFEGFEVQLKTIEGSAAAAEKSLAWITEFGKTTPYEVAGITDAFVRLKAQGIDPIANDSLRTLGDAASAMNKPLMQAVEAFTDASTFQFERLKEFGITSSQAGDQVTFQFTKNGETIKKVVKKDGEEIRRFLLENFGGRFAGAMDEQSRTFNGMMSNLSDAWTDFQRKIADAGFFKAITSRLQGLLDWIDRMDANGNLAKWAQSFSDALVSVIDGLTDFAARMKRHFDTIKEIIDGNSDRFKRWRKTILSIMGALFLALWPVTAALAAALLAAEDFMSYLGGGESVIGDFIAWLQDLTGASKETAEAIAAISAAVAVLMIAMGPMKLIRGMLKGLGAAAAGAGLIKGAGGAAGAGAAARGAGGLLGAAGRASPWLAAIAGAFIANKSRELDPDMQSDLDKFSAEEIERLNSEYGSKTPRETRGSALRKSRRQEFEQSAAEAEAGLGGGAGAVINDSRDQSATITNNVSVTQNVQQATDAPGAAAEATGRAVGSAARKAARVQAEGAR